MEGQKASDRRSVDTLGVVQSVMKNLPNPSGGVRFKELVQKVKPQEKESISEKETAVQMFMDLLFLN